MKIDINTLLILLGISFILQIAAIYLQYKINNTYKGIGFWTIGFIFFSSGFASAPLRNIAGLEYVIILLSNSFLVFGTIFIYAGIMRFFNRKENWFLISAVYFIYILSMLYFLLINNNINIRTVITSIVLSIFLFMESYALFFYKTRFVKASANFNLAILFLYGCFFILRALAAFFAGNIGSYFSSSFIQVSVFMTAFIEGILLTFGLIIMVNQRLNGEMKDAKDQKEIIFNSSPDGALITTIEDGIILEINDGFTHITGFSCDDSIGKSVLDIHLWGNPNDRKNIISILQEKGYCENVEVVLRRKDGKLITGMFSAKIVLLDNKPCILSVTRDITERKKEQLEKENLEAQNCELQKAESLGLMAGAIAHHFNNQLHSVMGNIELAADDRLNQKEPSDKLEDALYSARKAADVSKMMLSYLGQVHSKNEPLNVSDICRNYLPMLEAAKTKEAELFSEIENPGPVIISNSSHIQQILTNLINNAVEAGSLGHNAVQLSVKTVLFSDISSVNRFPVEWIPDKNKYACIEVADTGSGIDEKDIEKIFDPFFSKKFTGRGLGLSVVLGIIRTHNGAITVDSKTGHGSILRVYLPVTSEPVISIELKTEQALQTEMTGTILVVDDEPGILKIASVSLKKMGFSVLLARDGVEAVEIFKQKHETIVCVLLDLNMPRMNGWDALTEMRKINPGIQVILSSGYDENHVMVNKHDELPQIFLSKPYDIKSLHDSIQKALNSNK